MVLLLLTIRALIIMNRWLYLLTGCEYAQTHAQRGDTNLPSTTTTWCGLVSVAPKGAMGFMDVLVSKKIRARLAPGL
jgi:hypothetical protein